MNSTDVYEIVSTLLYIFAAVFFVMSVVLFFLLDIRTVLNNLHGRSALSVRIRKTVAIGKTEKTAENVSEQISKGCTGTVMIDNDGCGMTERFLETVNTIMMSDSEANDNGTVNESSEKGMMSANDGTVTEHPTADVATEESRTVVEFSRDNVISEKDGTVVEQSTRDTMRKENGTVVESFRRNAVSVESGTVVKHPAEDVITAKNGIKTEVSKEASVNEHVGLFFRPERKIIVYSSKQRIG